MDRLLSTDSDLIGRTIFGWFRRLVIRRRSGRRMLEGEMLDRKFIALGRAYHLAIDVELELLVSPGPAMGPIAHSGNPAVSMCDVTPIFSEPIYECESRFCLFPSFPVAIALTVSPSFD
jgi:hypothetical protein